MPHAPAVTISPLRPRRQCSVVTTALLRYGAFVGVVGSAVIFALMHGINAVIVTALVVGLIAA